MNPGKIQNVLLVKNNVFLLLDHEAYKEDNQKFWKTENPLFSLTKSLISVIVNIIFMVAMRTTK
jgi:hypothetical protein